MAAVSLVFGGACGDGGSDVSSSRMTKLAEDYCRQWEECDSEDFEQAYSQPSECVANTKAWLKLYTETYSKECADAIFDGWECENKLSCEAVDEGSDKCDKAWDRADEKCPDEDDYSYSSSRVSRVKRALRIPR